MYVIEWHHGCNKWLGLKCFSHDDTGFLPLRGNSFFQFFMAYFIKFMILSDILYIFRYPYHSIHALAIFFRLVLDSLRISCSIHCWSFVSRVPMRNSICSSSKKKSSRYAWVIGFLRGSLNNFPDFFRMGTFIDSTLIKL